MNLDNNKPWSVVVKGNPPPGFESHHQIVNKFCFAFFGKPKKCDVINCTYSHDKREYLETFHLQECPNNCGNFCKESSKICSTCVALWLANKELKQKEWEDKLLNRDSIKKCEGFNCYEMTHYKYCKQCSEVTKCYIKTR